MTYYITSMAFAMLAILCEDFQHKIVGHVREWRWRADRVDLDGRCNAAVHVNSASMMHQHICVA